MSQEGRKLIYQGQRCQLVESPKIFKRTLKKYLLSHCFYSLDEFYDVNV
jgi:hypothetical protein